MLPNKNEFITKINKITIEAETETKDEEIRCFQKEFVLQL